MPKTINIQAFAEPVEIQTTPSETQQNPVETPPPSEKTYTQEQINSMMANEKRTARQALLKELGYELQDDRSYRDVVKGIKEALDAGKTQAQLDAEAKVAAETARTEAENKAAKLEIKVAALSAKANPEYLDDLISLVMTKVSDTVTVETAIADLKSKYPAFFESSESSGTGHSNNPPRKPSTGGQGLGQRLAKASRNPVKSTYFKN